MNRFFSSSPIWLNEAIAAIRVIIGALLIYHGIEVFNPALVKGYVEGGMVKGQSALFMVYVGKASELIMGVLFFLGLLTRLGAVMMIGTFSYITFFIGQGRFWYEEQHPFMFVLFGILFLFTGPGAWSLDRIIFKRENV
jgi:putative oxidoreductase